LPTRTAGCMKALCVNIQAHTRRMMKRRTRSISPDGSVTTLGLYPGLLYVYICDELSSTASEIPRTRTTCLTGLGCKPYLRHSQWSARPEFHQSPQTVIQAALAVDYSFFSAS